MTFIGYPNISARSPNGAFRLEIAGTPTKDFFRDQSDFVYRLYRLDRLAWEWPAPRVKSDGSSLDDYPHEAWVSDEGWVVVRTHEWFHAGLLVFSPDGQIVLRRLHRRFDEGEPPGFLDTEPAEYMGDSSAGPFWSRSAIAYFTHHEGRPIWVIRTWWGRRVIVDLPRAQFIDPMAIDEDFARTIEIGQIDCALKVGVEMLAEETERLHVEEDPEDCAIARATMAPAYHAGWLQANSAVPLLRRMEAQGTSHHSVWFGPLGWASVTVLRIRQIAKLSLLRIGQEPSWLPHYGFNATCDVPNQLTHESTTFPLPEEGHARDAGLLEPGLTQHETLGRLGAPDFIGRGGGSDHWEYDFCSPSQTVRIEWDVSHLRSLRGADYKRMINENPPRIAQVEILAPQWKGITMRDHHVV